MFYVFDDFIGFLKIGVVCDGVKDKEDVCVLMMFLSFFFEF